MATIGNVSSPPTIYTAPSQVYSTNKDVAAAAPAEPKDVAISPPVNPPPSTSNTQDSTTQDSTTQNTPPPDPTATPPVAVYNALANASKSNIVGSNVNIQA